MSGSDCNFYDKRIAFLEAMIERNGAETFG